VKEKYEYKAHFDASERVTNLTKTRVGRKQALVAERKGLRDEDESKKAGIKMKGTRGDKVHLLPCVKKRVSQPTNRRNAPVQKSIVVGGRRKEASGEAKRD